MTAVYIGGAVLAAVVGAAACWLLLRLLPAWLGTRSAAAAACTAGLFSGNALAAVVPWAPDRSWHWILYLSLSAMVLGPLSRIGKPRGTLRCARQWPLYLLMGALAAWCLVPDWEALQPRWRHLAAVAAYVVLLTAMLHPLSDRRPRLLPAALSVAAVAATMLIAYLATLTVAEVAGLGAAAVAGCAAVAACRRPADNVIGGALLNYVVLVGGPVYIGYLYEADWWVLLVPAAPAALWALPMKAQAQTE